METLKVRLTGIYRCIQVDHRGGQTGRPEGKAYRCTQVYTLEALKVMLTGAYTQVDCNHTGLPE